MAFRWNPIAIPALAAATLALTLAAVVLATNRRAPANRALALVLAGEGVVTALGTIEQFLTAEDEAVRAANVVALAFFLVSLAYLRFLSFLDSPLTRPLRGRVAGGVLLAMAAAFVAGYAFGGPRPFVVGLEPGGFDTWDWVLGSAATAVFAAQALPPVFGLIASADAWRRAPVGTVARTRARSYAWAFGVRDLGYFSAIALSFIFLGGRVILPSHIVWAVLFPMATALGVLLLAYAILRTQLFDIDLKIKWGVARGTVVAGVVVLALVVAKIVEFYLSSAVGFVFGGVVAGLTLFLAPRLNRIADQVVSKAAPTVQPTSEYVAFRKLEVYRAAVESALETGDITARERASLDKLRAKLGIRGEDAGAVERDVAEILGKTAQAGAAPA